MERPSREPSATAGRAGTDRPRRRVDLKRSRCDRLAICSWAMLSVAIACGRDVTGGEAVPTRPARVDPAVTPAGGARAAHADCRECRRAACPQCRLAPERHPGHGPCQHGLCPAHCPVRPDVFGFYGTQWRRWPGSNVIQASNIEAASPARPPRSIVPLPLEESLEPAPGPQPLPAPPQAAAADAVPRRPVLPRDGEGQAARDQGMAVGRELGGEPGPSATEPNRPADAAARGKPPATAAPEDLPRAEAAGDDKAGPPRRPEAEKPAEQPGRPQENLFNLDERPQSAPWRSFTGRARLEARERR